MTTVMNVSQTNSSFPFAPPNWYHSHSDHDVNGMLNDELKHRCIEILDEQMEYVKNQYDAKTTPLWIGLALSITAVVCLVFIMFNRLLFLSFPLLQPFLLGGLAGVIGSLGPITWEVYKQRSNLLAEAVYLVALKKMALQIETNAMVCEAVRDTAWTKEWSADYKARVDAVTLDLAYRDIYEKGYRDDIAEVQNPWDAYNLLILR